MEEDEFEILRLKKLLEEKIIQVEKENMAILQGSNKMQEKIPQPVRQNIKRCPHTKTSPPVKLNDSDEEIRNIHSRIHFLKDLESTFLPVCNKRKMLIDRTRNVYIPCAIPLSPPIRTKKDSGHENENSSIELSPPVKLEREVPCENVISSNDQSYIPGDSVPKYSSNNILFNQNNHKSTLVHTCGKFLLNHQNEKTLPVHTSGKFLMTANCDNDRPSPAHTCSKSSKTDFTVIEKNLPLSSKDSEKRESFVSFSDKKETETKKAILNTSFIYKDKPSLNHTNCKTTFFPSKSASSFEEQITKPKTGESSSKSNEEKNGFNLHISLDSCSVKDVINTVLHKLPEVVDKFRASSSDINLDHSGNFLQKDHQGQCTFVPGCHNNPEVHLFEKLKKTVSSSSQTVPESFNNTSAGSKISEEKSKPVSSFVQTDQKKDDLLINKHELNHLVKDIVLETLQNMHVSTLSTKQTLPTICQKVDSGIQSEAESDVPERRQLRILDKDNIPHQKNCLSKSIQVDFNSLQIIEEKNVLDKGCNTESRSNSVHLLETESLLVSTVELDCELDSRILKRETSPVQEPNNRIEIMLEKIYEHVCQEKEQSKEFTDIPINTFLTRDVAVQFNPLHTCSKSTLTTEVKKVDSSSQYDVQLKTDLKQKLFVDASVQCVKESSQWMQVNAYTQYEHKSFIDSVVQTELLGNAEYSATNTSVSSTPVSDSMFVDDLLSEGEVSLPWNLRLLSQSGGNLNFFNTDSSETSVKEKDYSLSEGEIPPDIIRYLNMCHCNHTEENDPHCETHPKKIANDTKSQNTSWNDRDKLYQSTPHGKNLRLNISSSSLLEGEGNLNTPLSLGEISPGFRVTLGNSSTKTENNQSVRKANSCDQWPSGGSSQISDLSTYSGYSEGEVHSSDYELADVGNASRNVLQTVDEEIHSMFD